MPTRLEHLGLGRHRPEVRFSTRLVPPGLWITPWIARPARLAVLIVPLSPHRSRPHPHTMNRYQWVCGWGRLRFGKGSRQRDGGRDQTNG